MVAARALCKPKASRCYSLVKVPPGRNTGA